MSSSAQICVYYDSDLLGDSLHATGQGPGCPTKFITSLQSWVKAAFGKCFADKQNSPKHAVQDDSFSCGILTANTIDRTMFDQQLLNPNCAAESRVAWFIRLALKVTTSGPSSHEPSTKPLWIVRQRLTMTDLLNPPAEDSESDSSASDFSDDNRSNGTFYMKQVKATDQADKLNPKLTILSTPPSMKASSNGLEPYPVTWNETTSIDATDTDMGFNEIAGPQPSAGSAAKKNDLGAPPPHLQMMKGPQMLRLSLYASLSRLERAKANQLTLHGSNARGSSKKPSFWTKTSIRNGRELFVMMTRMLNLTRTFAVFAIQFVVIL